MGAAYYIRTEDGTLDFAGAVDGKALAAASDELDELAAELGIRKISDFLWMGGEELLEYFGDELEAEAQPFAEIGPWFSPEDGLATTRALQRYITANPTCLDSAELVLADLRSLEHALVLIGERRTRWRLSVDI